MHFGDNYNISKTIIRIIPSSIKLRSITWPQCENNWKLGFAGNIVHEVVIPENVQSIGIDAFASHNTLSDVYCLSKNPPVIDTGIETAENSD